jgi:hypothetical protein
MNNRIFRENQNTSFMHNSIFRKNQNFFMPKSILCENQITSFMTNRIFRENRNTSLCQMAFFAKIKTYFMHKSIFREYHIASFMPNRIFRENRNTSFMPNGIFHENQTNLLCPIAVFAKILPFMRKCEENNVERGRPQIKTWRIRDACRLIQATNTHSEYVILIAFPLQQCLHEGGCVLRHTLNLLHVGNTVLP